MSAAFLLRVASIASPLPRGGQGSKCGTDGIRWIITAPAPVIFDGRGPAPGKTARPKHRSFPGTLDQVPLAGLKSNSLYHYSVGEYPNHSFRVPPPPETRISASMLKTTMVRERYPTRWRSSISIAVALPRHQVGRQLCTSLEVCRDPYGPKGPAHERGP